MKGLIIMTSLCIVPEAAHYLCEIENTDKPDVFQNISVPELVIDEHKNQSIPFPHVTCPEGHVTHTFLACDTQSSCFPESYISGDDLDPPSCPVELHPLPPSFVCGSGGESVAYSLVCDHRQDCMDGSDESFCLFDLCPQERPLHCGTSKQCVSQDMTCNSALDCVNENDERECGSFDESKILNSISPPALVRVRTNRDLRYRTELHIEKHRGPCPHGFFQCSEDGYCLELMFRCNTVDDCPGREDEAGCSEYSCPGLYRCLGSRICLLDSDLCDGYPECPQYDDEQFCHLICPSNCTCYGSAFFCPGVFSAHQSPDCRYLDASDSGLMPQDLVHNTLLVYLSLARCGLTHFTDVTLRNLIHLDIRDNHIREVTARHLKSLKTLRVLLLAGNPLTTVGLWDTEMFGLELTLRVLDLSRVTLPVLRFNSPLPNLQRLDVSATGLNHLQEPGFSLLTGLHLLDLRGCPLSRLPRQLFQGLYQLRKVHADSYRVCCKATLPAGFNPNNCQAPENNLSSCQKLLKNSVHVICVAVFSTICIISNIIHVVLHAFVRKNTNQSTCTILLSHLCVSDVLMGFYLAIIGIADHIYLDTYQWEDIRWRNSLSCKLTGFLFLLSCEVSSFIVFSITVERLVAIQQEHPKRQITSTSGHGTGVNWQITSTVVHGTGAVCWVCGLAVAAVPFLWNQGQFTSSGLCVPVPFSLASYGYFHSVIVVFLSGLHGVVLVLQAFIYIKTQPSILTCLDTTDGPTTSEASLARRFVPVALSRCVCWVTLAAMGWTLCRHQRDSACSGGMRETLGVVVLPLSSVLQPVMYSYGLWQERQRALHQERVRQFIQAKRRARANKGATTGKQNT